MNIKTYYNAAIGATYDRKDVNRLSKRNNLSAADKSYLKELTAQSGPSAHNPIKAIKNWFKAYRNNLALQKEISAIKAPFEKISFLKKLIKHI